MLTKFFYKLCLFSVSVIFLTLGCKNTTHEFTKSNDSVDVIASMASLRAKFNSGDVVAGLNLPDSDSFVSRVVNRTDKSVTNFISKSTGPGSFSGFDFANDVGGGEPDDKKDRLQIEWNYSSMIKECADIDTFVFCYIVPFRHNGVQSQVKWITEVAPSRGKFVSDCGDLGSLQAFRIDIYAKRYDGRKPNKDNPDEVEYYYDGELTGLTDYWHLTNISIKTLKFSGHNYIGFMGYDARKGIDYNPSNLVSCWMLDMNRLMNDEPGAIGVMDVSSSSGTYNAGSSTDLYTWLATCGSGAYETDLSSFLDIGGLTNYVQSQITSASQTSGNLARSYINYYQQNYDSNGELIQHESFKGIINNDFDTSIANPIQYMKNNGIQSFGDVYKKEFDYYNSPQYSSYKNGSLGTGALNSLVNTAGGLLSPMLSWFNFSDKKVEIDGGEESVTEGFGNFNFKVKKTKEYLHSDKYKQIPKYLSWMFKRDLDGVKDENGNWKFEPLSPDLLFDKYGTHMILSMDFGGKLSVDFTYKDGYKYSYETTKSLTKKWGGVKSDDNSEESKSEKEIEKNSQLHTNVYGGIGTVAIVNTMSDYLNAVSNWGSTVTSDNAVFIDSENLISDQNTYTGIWNYASTVERKSEIYAEYIRALNENYETTLLEAYGVSGNYLGDIRFSKMDDKSFTTRNAKNHIMTEIYNSSLIEGSDVNKIYVAGKPIVNASNNALIDFVNAKTSQSTGTFCAGLYTAEPIYALRGVAVTTVKGRNDFESHAQEFINKYGYQDLRDKINKSEKSIGGEGCKWYMCEGNESDTQIWKSWNNTIRQERFDDTEGLLPIIECSIFAHNADLSQSGWKIVKSVSGKNDAFNLSSYSVSDLGVQNLAIRLP